MPEFVSYVRTRPNSWTPPHTEPSTEKLKELRSLFNNGNPYNIVRPTFDTADPVVDIVAIHGLSGHPTGTWSTHRKGRERFWPSAIANNFSGSARVISYGYENENGTLSVQDTRASGGPVGRVRKFLHRVAMERQSVGREDKPIIFVAHSLGGLVVKQALIEMMNDSQVEGAKGTHLFQARTYGIITLTTHRRGSALSNLSLTAAQLACLVVLSNYRPSVDYPNAEAKSSYYKASCSCLKLLAYKDSSSVHCILSSLKVAEVLSSFSTAGRHILGNWRSGSMTCLSLLMDILNPTPSEYVSAAIIYGIATMVLYDINRGDAYQGHSLMVAIVVGVAASCAAWARCGVDITGAAIPFSITLALTCSVCAHWLYRNAFIGKNHGPVDNILQAWIEEIRKVPNGSFVPKYWEIPCS